MEGAVTVVYVAAPVPSLAGHRLTGDDGVDDRTVRFLLKQSLALKKEEERRRMALESIERMLEDAVRHESSSSTAKRRKRKRKRKRDFLGRVAALIVVNGSVMSMAGFAVLVLLTMQFPSSVGRTLLPGIIVGMDQKDLFHRAFVDSDSGIYKAGFAGCFSRCVSSRCRQAPDARHHCRYGPDGQLRGEILADMVLMVQFFLYSTLSGSTVDTCSASVYEAFWTFHLVWYRGRFPWSRLLWTTEFLQLLRKVIDVPGCRSCRFSSLLMRRGGFPWSRLLSDQRDSPVRRHGGRCPCCACGASSQVPSWRR